MGTTKKRGKQNYYVDAEMSPEALLDMVRASKVVGLKDEIALVRRQVKLVANAGSRTQRKARQDLRAVAAGMDTLHRLVTADHRMGARSSEDVSDTLSTLLNQFGDQILPADR